MVKFINGPTNFVYLKGKINNIDKDIYLFFDNHYDLNNQTRCESFDSIDISQYLYNIIKNTKIPLDFFMEIRYSQLEEPLTNKKDIYIKEVIEMFKSEFIIEKDEVKYSKSNPNVRLHYLDIRDKLDMFYIIHIIKYDIFNEISLLTKNNNNKININNIFNYIKIINKYLNRLQKNINELKFSPKDKYDKNNKQLYNINKVMNQYNNNELKEKMISFIDIHYLYILNTIKHELNIVKPYLEYYDIKYITIIKDKFQNIYNLTVDLYSLFVDTYLLRRILDKNYINNCIVYTGSQHSVNYIYFLIKYYDFELITIHDSIEKNINELIQKIKKEEYVFDIYKLFYINEKKYLQCLKIYKPFPNKHRGGNIEYFDFND